MTASLPGRNMGQGSHEGLPGGRVIQAGGGSGE